MLTTFFYAFLLTSLKPMIQTPFCLKKVNHVSFTKDIYQKIRDRLTSVTVKQAGQLGEVYAKAWAASGGQFQVGIL